MRISDWSSDVCSSDLDDRPSRRRSGDQPVRRGYGAQPVAGKGAGDDHRVAGQRQRKRPSRPPAGACRFPCDRHRRLARRPAAALGIEMTTDLQTMIDAAWDACDTLGLTTRGPVREEVEAPPAGDRKSNSLNSNI